MKRIGRYIVRGLLGRGGMGKVFKVELPVIGRTAALKLLQPDPLIEGLMGREAIRTVFEKEAVTMAGLNHPHIVSINDYDHARDKLFYVMDFFANNLGTIMGESYTVERPSRAIPVDKAIRYTRQTIAGLGCLHDAGIVHRDIKPYNLLITPWDTLKICDFGLSKLRGERYAGPSNLKVGSPYYAAPEQERNPDHVDHRADLYPVGVMLYRMLSGSLPEIKTDGTGYAPLGTCHPDLDERWDQFILQAAAVDPQQRFPSAKAMLAALDHLEAHWREEKERSCRMLAGEPQRRQVTGTALLRGEPVKCPPTEAVLKFDLDALWRPNRYHAGDLTLERDGVILDRATNLRWQRAGSEYPKAWPQALRYIEHLNETGFGGYRNWRLPTVDELMSLLSPVPQGRDRCIAPLFETTQRWLWSADRRSYVASYYVDVELGFVGWQDFSAPYYARAVCSDPNRGRNGKS
jgi:serine/threonine protein kinase